MKISLTASGLLDPRRLDSWVPERRRAIRQAVAAGMRSAGRDIVNVARATMQSAFTVRRIGFVKSMRSRVYAGNPDRMPALYIGSKIPWLGIHTRGGTISGRMLIPLLPEHQRIGRKRFRTIIDGLMRAGNAFVVKTGRYAVVMAENIRENDPQLARFKRAQRARTGAKRIRRGQEIPIAVLVRRVTLKRRFDFARVVRDELPRLAVAIRRAMSRV